MLIKILFSKISSSKNHIRVTSTCLEELKHKKINKSTFAWRESNFFLIQLFLSLPLSSRQWEIYETSVSFTQLILSLNSSLETSFQHLKHDLNRWEGIIWLDLYLLLELFISILLRIYLEDLGRKYRSIIRMKIRDVFRR